MRKLISLLVTLVLISCSKSEIAFKDNLGNDIKLSALNNQWLIVSYWAPWCHTCLKEIPELNKFYQNHQHSKLLFLGVNYDSFDNEPIEPILQKAHIAFPVLMNDPVHAWNLGSIDAVPTTFILNPHGQVMKKIIGPVTENSLATTLNELQQLPS